MKIKVILITSVIIGLSIFNLCAQDKITIVEERTTTTERNWDTNETRSRTSSTYYFRLGDNGKVMSAGKKGKDLRKHIKDEKALKLFDKSLKQVRWGNRTFLGMIGGAGIMVAGLSYSGQKFDDNGDLKREVPIYNPILIGGGVLILSSIIAKPILHKKFDRNFAKSIEMHNNSISSGNSSNNIRIENVGFTLDSRTSRPQLYLGWRF